MPPREAGQITPQHRTVWEHVNSLFRAAGSPGLKGCWMAPQGDVNGLDGLDGAEKKIACHAPTWVLETLLKGRKKT